VSFRLRHLGAWAPGAASDDEWRAWARGERSLGDEGRPDVRFLPAMLRRRCSTLSRMALFAASQACPKDERSRVRLIFGSRHGEIATTARILRAMAANEGVSPTSFSHSVHNTPAGLFSIAEGNHVGATALSAGADTFGCSLLEAALCLDQTPLCPTLLVVADEPLPSPFERFADEDQTPYALALLLDQVDTSSEGLEMELALDAGPGVAQGATGVNELPQALLTLGWLLRDDPVPLTLPTLDHAWILSRRSGISPRTNAAG
jgi:hypothetical protein